MGRGREGRVECAGGEGRGDGWRGRKGKATGFVRSQGRGRSGRATGDSRSPAGATGDLRSPAGEGARAAYWNLCVSANGLACVHICIYVTATPIGAS